MTQSKCMVLRTDSSTCSRWTERLYSIWAWHTEPNAAGYTLMLYLFKVQQLPLLQRTLSPPKYLTTSSLVLKMLLCYLQMFSQTQFRLQQRLTGCDASLCLHFHSLLLYFAVHRERHWWTWQVWIKENTIFNSVVKMITTKPQLWINSCGFCFWPTLYSAVASCYMAGCFMLMKVHLKGFLSCRPHPGQ